jgi:5'-nucleotidase
MKVLLTNDDGIEAEGLQALRRALLGVPEVELAVIAPDGNRSAMARSITTRRPLWVEEVDFGDGTVGYATDGTPVDCVRFATLGLIDGFKADLIVAGINHGANLGRRHHLLGHGRRRTGGHRARRARASRSRSSRARASSTSASASVRLRRSPRASPPGRRRARRRPAARGTLPEHQRPAGEPDGVDVTRLGKRHLPRRAQAAREDGQRRATGSTATIPGYHDEQGTDLAAVAAGRIAVTPLHFDLTDTEGMDALELHDLSRLLAPAAEEVE